VEKLLADKNCIDVKVQALSIVLLVVFANKIIGGVIEEYLMKKYI